MLSIPAASFITACICVYDVLVNQRSTNGSRTQSTTSCCLQSTPTTSGRTTELVTYCQLPVSLCPRLHLLLRSIVYVCFYVRSNTAELHTEFSVHVYRIAVARSSSDALRYVMYFRFVDNVVLSHGVLDGTLCLFLGCESVIRFVCCAAVWLIARRCQSFTMRESEWCVCVCVCIKVKAKFSHTR